jgi:hypothetical protein
MIEILHEKDGTRTALLSRSCHQDSLKQTIVTMDEEQAIFAQMVSDGKNRRFRLSGREVEAFIEAWTKHKADAQAKAEAGQAEWDAKIEATRKRAEAVGALLTGYNPYTLTWPAGSPLERYNRQWVTGNSGLYLSDVQGRLKQVEEHMQEVQIQDDSKGVSNYTMDYDQLVKRAQAIGALFLESSPHPGRERYTLAFRDDHPFFGFWKEHHNLTLGQVGYRVRYVEHVMRQTAMEVTPA